MEAVLARLNRWTWEGLWCTLGCGMVAGGAYAWDWVGLFVATSCAGVFVMGAWCGIALALAALRTHLDTAIAPEQ